MPSVCTKKMLQRVFVSGMLDSSLCSLYVLFFFSIVAVFVFIFCFFLFEKETKSIFFLIRLLICWIFVHPVCLERWSGGLTTISTILNLDISLVLSKLPICTCREAFSDPIRPFRFFGLYWKRCMKKLFSFPLLVLNISCLNCLDGPPLRDRFKAIFNSFFLFSFFGLLYFSISIDCWLFSDSNDVVSFGDGR